MKNWLAKSILEKQDIQCIFSLGTWGKSLALSSCKMISKVDKKEMLTLLDNGSLSQALLTKGGERGLLGALLASFSSTSHPEYLALEIKKNGQIAESLMPHITNPIVVISALGDEELKDKTTLKKYLEARIPLFKSNPKSIQVVFNADIPKLQEVLEGYKLKSMTSFALEATGADIRASNIDFSLGEAESIDQRLKGVTCKVQHFGSTVPLQINGGIGRPHLYAKLASLGLAHVLGVSAVELLGFLRQEPLLPGRMRLVPGIKKSIIVDDSYEMSYETAQMAIQEASLIVKGEGQKRIAILGSMAHEGRYTDQHHCLLGQQIATLDYDMVVAVGEKGYDILRCAEEAGMDPGHLHHFTSKDEAGRFVQHELRMGDIILVKGNKEEQFETIVKELMAFPLQAKDDLLQR